MSHTMHTNSLDAYEHDHGVLSYRARLIYNMMLKHKQVLTDRQIQKALLFEERGMVQPRVSDLVEAGPLVEVDKVKCEKTGKSVRRTQCAIHYNGQQSLF